MNVRFTPIDYESGPASLNVKTFRPAKLVHRKHSNFHSDLFPLPNTSSNLGPHFGPSQTASRARARRLFLFAVLFVIRFATADKWTSGLRPRDECISCGHQSVISTTKISQLFFGAFWLHFTRSLPEWHNRLVY